MKNIILILTLTASFNFLYSQSKNEKIIYSLIKEVENYDLEQFKNWNIFVRSNYCFICSYSIKDSTIFSCSVRKTMDGNLVVQESEPHWYHGELPYEKKFYTGEEKYPFNPDFLKQLLSIVMNYELTDVYYSHESNSIFFNHSDFAVRYYYNANADIKLIEDFNYKKINDYWYYKVVTKK